MSVLLLLRLLLFLLLLLLLHLLLCSCNFIVLLFIKLSVSIFFLLHFYSFFNFSISYSFFITYILFPPAFRLWHLMTFFPPFPLSSQLLLLLLLLLSSPPIRLTFLPHSIFSKFRFFTASIFCFLLHSSLFLPSPFLSFASSCLLVFLLNLSIIFSHLL